MVWKEVEEEFERGSLQAFQAAVTGRSTWEGRTSRSPRSRASGGVKFPETAKIRREQNEGEKGQGFQCTHGDSDRLPKGPTVALS